MDNTLIQRINEETDIVALASEFMSLTKRGKNYMGLCPFHDEKTPSFSVSPEKHLAFCMGCRKGGSPIQFFSQIKNISFGDAANELAQRLGITYKKEVKIVDPNQKYYDLMQDTTEFYKFALMNSEAGQEALKYLKNRGLTDEDINHFEIGYAPSKIDALYQMLKTKKHFVSDMMSLGLVKQNEEGEYYDVFRSRIMFPIKNEKGLIVGFSGRTTDKNEVAKYVNSTETPIFKKGETLYHYTESIRPAVKQKYVILNEGFFDVIQTYKSGLEAVVASMGTAITKHQAQLIKRITDLVVIAYDGDNAGLNATIKAIPVLREAGLKISILGLPEKLDPDEYIKKYGYEKYRNLYLNNLVDPYLFSYAFFSKGKDFTKADDQLSFKKQLSNVLKGADQIILDFYERKTFDEFNIKLGLSSNKVVAAVKKAVEKELNASENRASSAFDFMMKDLFQRSYWLDKLRNEISIYHITNKLHKELYKELDKYYQDYQVSELDPDFYLNHITKYQEEVKTYLNSLNVRKKIRINDYKAIDEGIIRIKIYQNYLLLSDLLYELERAKDIETRDELLIKIQELQKITKEGTIA